MENTNQYVVNEGKKRFQQIMEYIVNQGAHVIEADDEQQPQDAPQGGADMGSGMPQGDADMGGADMGSGMPQGDADMGGADMGGGMPQGGADMGGADMGGGMPQDGSDMGGGMPQDGSDMGGGQTPEGFNPQGGADMGGAPMDGGMPQGDTMQPDDEVIDMTDITDAQDEMSDEIEEVGGKFDKVLKTLGSLEAMLKANDDKINALTSEFEKRNPTNIEKLGMQASKSYPFNVKPEDYWRDKTENSNYSLEDDNNGVGEERYSITNSDVNDNNWKSIADSLDDEDSFMYNQTLNNLLHVR